MNNAKQYTEYSVEQAVKLLSIDSPTGYTFAAEEHLLRTFRELGYAPVHTVKGGILVDLGGKDAENGLLLEAHCDTLGAMVAEVKGNGRLRVLPLGGLPPVMANTENCRVVTKFDGSYEGTLQICNASTHVNRALRDTVPSYENTEIVLDELVSSDDEAKQLGIGVGDVVCFDPRTRVTEKGVTPSRRIYLHFTVYEEVGHGGAGSVPAGVTEAISVDMGCVGEGLQCTERQVSICAKDSGGPYSYEVVKGLISAAKAQEADYAVDVYPHYGSDVEATLSAGWDLRHGLIGPGVYASHGYERSHKDGVENTLKVLVGYIGA